MPPSTIEPTVGRLLARAVDEFGDHTYLVSPTARLTYAEALHRSGLAARQLLRDGIGKGARVGLLFPNDADWIVWWLAVSRIGAVAVPLSTLYTPAELGKVIRLADIGVLVAPPNIPGGETADKLEAALPGLAATPTPALSLPTAPYLRRIAIPGGAGRAWADVAAPDESTALAPEILAAVENEVSPADLAIMIHTSGSTADPKGVLHTHGTLVRQTAGWADAIRGLCNGSAAPRVLSSMPFFWIGGVLAATGALHQPVTLLVMPRPEAGVALDLIERERGEGIVGWPAFTQRLREHPSFPDRDLSAAPLLREGPLDIAMHNVPDRFPIHRTLSESAGSFAHTDMKIVDPQGDPVPVGATGELLIRGIGSMAGYNKRERHDVFDPDGWYHTGDRVYRIPEDPRLFYVGRTSELIKVAGANVSPREVEAVVEQHDGVQQCLVVGVEHPERGEQVCAVIVPASDGPDTLDLDAIATHTRRELSAYKVPTRWIITSSDTIPTLPSGKLDRRGLRTQVADGTLK
ncbi:class I adenylate-forming enzyme family protein [Nocardia bovistercoris]|uniref:Acyl--CoA ligase n=1 Tax=Nocardia bovistercoris TaxID=2785916 RepID=A0A931IEB9_9NOCA|nr:class I adenylate-forming enzyme family protein [Nocardia bovistercoris]MBH0779636.1 acyl--CoA ligase [Nocardia bovistercoris]